MLIRALYYLLLPLLWLSAWGLAGFLPKLRAGLIQRQGWRTELRGATRRRNRDKPLVWVHAASAGEFLQAEPVLNRLRAEDVELAVTLSSVSGLPWLARMADWPQRIWSGLLPLDFPWNTALLLRLLAPQVIVHVQAELWPGLVWAAQRKGVAQLVIAARTGQGRNYRAHPCLRPFFGALYGPLAAILCLSERDRRGIAAIVPTHPRVEAVGDPGCETVLRRKEETSPALKTWLPPSARVLVAGSSWPADEKALLPPLKNALRQDAQLRMIIAPHEPGEAALQSLEQELVEAGTLRFSCLKADSAKEARVLLVDVMGQLAGLYRWADIAYVGGGFSSGVHNVAEPAAWGVPVLFGPRHRNSALAALLLAQGAALAPGQPPEEAAAFPELPSLPTDPQAALAAALQALWSNPSLRKAMGERAAHVVKAQAPAAQRCAQVIQSLLTPGQQR